MGLRWALKARILKGEPYQVGWHKNKNVCCLPWHLHFSWHQGWKAWYLLEVSTLPLARRAFHHQWAYFHNTSFSCLSQSQSCRVIHVSKGYYWIYSDTDPANSDSHENLWIMQQFKVVGYTRGGETTPRHKKPGSLYVYCYDQFDYQHIFSIETPYWHKCINGYSYTNK